MMWKRAVMLDSSMAVLLVACSVQRSGTGADLENDPSDANQVSSEVEASGGTHRC